MKGAERLETWLERSGVAHSVGVGAQVHGMIARARPSLMRQAQLKGV